MPVESELLEEFDISALGNNAKEPQVESELLGEFDPSDLIKVRNAKKLDDAISRTVGDKDREAFNRVDWYTEHIPFFKQVKDAVVGVAGATAQPRESEQRNQRGEIVNAPQDGSSLSTKANAAYKRITESPEDALDSDFDVIAQATAKGVWNAPKGWKDYVGHTVAGATTFMGEMAATGGLSALPEALTPAAARLVGAKTAANAAGKQIVSGTTAQKAGAWALAGGGSAIPQAALHTSDEYERLVMPTAQEVKDKEGNILRDGEGNINWNVLAGQDPGMATAAKAFYNAYRESLTERVGGDLINKATGRVAAAGLKKVPDFLAKRLAWLAGGGLGGKAASEAGFSGIAGEFGEERLGEVLGMIPTAMGVDLGGNMEQVGGITYGTGAAIGNLAQGNLPGAMRHAGNVAYQGSAELAAFGAMGGAMNAPAFARDVGSIREVAGDIWRGSTDQKMWDDHRKEQAELWKNSFLNKAAVAKSKADREQIADKIKDVDMGEHNELRDKFVASQSRKDLNALKAAVAPVTKPVESQAEPVDFGMTPESVGKDAAFNEPLPEQQATPVQQTPETVSPVTPVDSQPERSSDPNVEVQTEEGQGNQEGLLTQPDLEANPSQPIEPAAVEQQPPGGSGLKNGPLPKLSRDTSVTWEGKKGQVWRDDGTTVRILGEDDRSITVDRAKVSPLTAESMGLKEGDQVTVRGMEVTFTYQSTEPDGRIKLKENGVAAREMVTAPHRVTPKSKPTVGSGLRGAELGATVQQHAPVATSEPIMVGAKSVTVGKADTLQDQANELVSRGSTVGGIQKELGVGFQRATELHNAAQQSSPTEPAKPQYTPLQTPPDQMTVQQIERELGNTPPQSRANELIQSLRSRVPESQGAESTTRTPDVAQVNPEAPLRTNETPTVSNPVPVAPIASQQPSVSPNAAKDYAPIVLPTPVSQAPVASQAVEPVKNVSVPVTPSVTTETQQTQRQQGPGLAARRSPATQAAIPSVTAPGQSRPTAQAPPTTWQEAFERWQGKAAPQVVPREQASSKAQLAAERLERFSRIKVVIVHSDDNNEMAGALHIPVDGDQSVILINNRLITDDATDKAVWLAIGDELSHATGIDSGNWLDAEELADWSKKYLYGDAELGALGVPQWYQAKLLNEPGHTELKKEATAMWLANTFFQQPDIQQALFNTNPSIWKQIVDMLMSLINAKPSLEKSLSPKQFAIYKALTERLIQENGTASDAAAGGYTLEKLLSDYKRIGGLNDQQVDAMRTVWEGFARNVAKMKNANEFVTKYIKGMSEESVDGKIGILMQPAFQGSGVMFDKHSSEYFGTGEGNAAFGVGHYFTDDLGVAGHYREIASRNRGSRESAKSINSRTASKYNISTETVEFLGGKQGSLHTARDLAMDSVVRNQRLADQDVNELAMGIAGIRSWDQLPNYQLDEYQAYDEHEPLMRREDFIEQAEEELRDYYDVWHKYRRIAEDIDNLIVSGKGYKPVKPGAIYQVELAPTDEELFLWDKSISEQPAKVKEAMGKIADRYGFRIPAVSAKQRYWTGGDFYKALADALDVSTQPSEEAIRKIAELNRLRGDITTATTTVFDGDGYVYAEISDVLKDWIVNFIGKQAIKLDDMSGEYRVEMSIVAFRHMLDSFVSELEAEKRALRPRMTDRQKGKLASETLLHYGIRGNKHYTRSTRTGRSEEVKYNYVIFSDDDVEITAVYLQKDGQAKGAVQLWEDGSALLYSFKTADFSTHVHEFSHIARQHLTGEDADLANTYVGATSNEWSEEQEEKFANGFERFLREGNIDGTAHMKSLWERMKSWMVGIYRTIKRGSRLDLEVSKEVQAVYAKMIGADPNADYAKIEKQLTEEGTAFAAMIDRQITPEFSVEKKGKLDPKENVYSLVAMNLARRWEKETPEKQQELAADTEEGHLARLRYAGKSVSNAVVSENRTAEKKSAGGQGRKVSLNNEGKEFMRLYDGQPIPGDIRHLREGLELAAKKFQKLSPEQKANLLANKQARNQFVSEANDSWVSGQREVFTDVSLDYDNPVTGTSLAGEIPDTRELTPEEAAEKQEDIAFAREIMADNADDPVVIMGFDAMIRTDKSTPGHISKAEYARQKNVKVYRVNEAIDKAEKRKAQIRAAKGIGSPSMSPGYAALLNNDPPRQPPPPNQTLNGPTVIHGTQAIRNRIRDGLLQLDVGIGKPKSFDPTTGEKAPAEYKRSGEYVTFLANTIGYARLIAHEVGHHISNTTTVFNFLGTKARLDLGHIITQAANHNAAQPGQDMTKFITRLQRRGANEQTIKAVAERRYNDAMNEVVRQFGTPTLEQRLAMDDLRGLDPMVITFSNPNHPLHRPKSRGNVEEGFAEFMRHVAEGDAATVAPKAWAQYQEWAKTQPEVAKEIETAMKMLGDYLRATPQQKMQTQISNDGFAASPAGQTFKEKGLTWLRSLKDGFDFAVDQASLFKNITERIKELGFVRREGQLDPATAFNTLHGTGAKNGARAFQDGIFHLLHSRYGEKLSGVSFPNELLAAALTFEQQDDFIEVILAWQKLEIEDKINSVRRANGQKEYVDSDLSLDDARAIDANAKKNPELYKKFKHLHRMYVQVYRDLYEMYAAATGLPAIDTPLDAYVAMKRVFDDNGALSEAGKSFTTPRTPFKSRTLGGATLPIVHPFTSLQRDINKFYDLATQHQFWTTVYNSIDPERGGADGSQFAQKQDAKIVVTKESLEKVFPGLSKDLLAAGVSQQAIDDIENNPFAMQVAVTILKTEHRPNDVRGDVVHIETDYYDSATGQFVPLDKPRLVTYRWNKDLYPMLKQLGMSWKQTEWGKSARTFFTVLNFFAKTFKTNVINRNPAYAVTARNHDQLQFMERSKETTLAERFQAPFIADADLTKYRNKRRLEMLPKFITNLIPKSVIASITGNDNEITEMFMFDVGSMASQGGERSRGGEGDVFHMRVKSSVKAGENRLAYRTLDAIASADHEFQVFLATFEMAPRLAEYKAALRNDGYSIDKDGKVIETATGQQTKLPYDVRMRAKSVALDVTINFSHSGPGMQLLETIAPLFSAAATGQKQKYEFRTKMAKGLLKGDKKAIGWAVVVAGFVAAGMIEYWRNRDDEEWNEQEYWQRQQWTNLGWFRLLKGRDTGIFMNLGNSIAAALNGDLETSRQMSSNDLMGMRVPFGDEIPLPNPLLIDTAYEVWAGTNRFTGKDLDNDTEVKTLLPKDRGAGRASNTSRAIGYASGLGQDKNPGVSPNVVQHVLNRFTGGAYERVTDTADSAAGYVRDKVMGKETQSWRAKDIPAVGKFIDWNPHRRSESEMQEATERTNQSIGSHKRNAPGEGEDATLWNARNTDLHNAAYRYERSKQMRGELYGLWRGADGDHAKQVEIMNLITGTARAALKKEDAGKFPNPFRPTTPIPEYAREAVKKELVDVLNKALEPMLAESKKKKDDKSDLQITGARQFLKDNGWTLPQLEGLLNEAMPKWTEAKRNRLSLLRRVM